MSTTAIHDYTDAAADESMHYRAIHTGAIVGLVVGVASSLILICASTSFGSCVMAAPIPAIGVAVSLMSLGTIRKNRDQYTGEWIALAGLVLSAFFLISGLSYGYYVYATEIPIADPPYTRISFEELRPTDQQERAGKLVPPEIMALNGKRVFIKGYIRPNSSPNGMRTSIESFLLVRDNNECCFGDQSKIKFYDQIKVQITTSARVDDTLRLIRIGGILQINPENVNLGPLVPIYSLKADYVKQ